MLFEMETTHTLLKSPCSYRRVLAFGAANGAAYGFVLFLLMNLYSDYLNRQSIQEAESLGRDPVLTTDNLNIPMIVCLLTLFFAFGSGLVHFLWRRLYKNPIVFWQAAGVSSIMAWNIAMITALWLEKHLTGQTLSYERVISVSNPLFGPISLVLVILVNLVFAIIIQNFFYKWLQLNTD